MAEGNRLGDVDAPFDLAGIGFGPSNLALAVCAQEVDPGQRCIFLERNQDFCWHRGMLINDARMQISFLKDLVSLRNLASPYSFLRYLKAHDRLEDFVNLTEFHPTRMEFEDYLRWVAADFADHVRYSTTVVSVHPATSEDGQLNLFRLETIETPTGRRASVYTRNVVYAAGGRPQLPAGVGVDGVIHSSEFMHEFPAQFPDRGQTYTVVVVGGGQSSGEIVEYLLDQYEKVAIHLVISGYAPRPTDNSSFVNEQFSSPRVDEFYRFDHEKRKGITEELRGANYGVIREDVLERIYSTAYLDKVKGRQRLFLHPFSRLTGVRRLGTGLVADLEDRLDGSGEHVATDSVILATGYSRGLDPLVFDDVRPLVITTHGDVPEISRNHRVRTLPQLRAGLYVQGYGEQHLGLGDTLLSLLPFRSAEIFDDIRNSNAEEVTTAAVQYPLERYVESDTEKLYALIERYMFATVVAAAGVDEPLVTRLPLVLHRQRGDKGVLFGHMDRNNPQVRVLDGHRLAVLFHGPNGYMSPKIYSNDPLPTWNSMAVHVRGRARIVHNRDAIVRGLCDIASRSDSEPILSANDVRIGKLIDHIVGFEIEIDELVGRFKLSQEHDAVNRLRAAEALAEKTESGDREFIEYIVGLPLTSKRDPLLVGNGSAQRHTKGHCHEQ